MKQLSLSVNLEGWLLYMRRKADPAFRRIRDQIFKRDNYTCQFCGFQAQEYQEVINLDGNYRHNHSKNLATACCFCSQCFFVDAVGQSDFGGGKLIVLPEMSQVELNGLCHVLFCAMHNGTDYHDVAQSVYRHLKFRSQQLESKYGEGCGRPDQFGRLISEFDTDVDVNEIFKNLRLLPAYSKFTRQLAKWAESAAEELAEKS